MNSSTALAIARSALAAVAAALLLPGCASVGYYWQSVSGHMQMLGSARPVDDWLADARTPERLKARLALSQRIRSFAVTALKLPNNASYHRYADLRRSAVVWNVVAAPALSLTLKTWCFPVAGCVGYRGYFNEADARAEADKLRAQGLEVSVYGVPAYSTLGWMNWAGGDPLLNTFIHYPEGELARIIFHELAHQVVYASGDTVFNESFATAVERLGSQRWLAGEASEAARQDYAALEARRQAFRALALATRRELAGIYGQKEAVAHEGRAQSATNLIAKEAAMQRFRDGYAQLKASWGGFAGYDRWVANANNASFGAQAAYDELVPGFEALFEREGHDWQRFYDAVKRLAGLPKDQRHQALKTGDTHQQGDPMADIHIERQHGMSLAQARKAAFKWAEQAEEKFDMQCTYEEGQTCDEVSFTRAGVSGTLLVTKDSFELQARLGFLLGAFKDRIENEIVGHLDALIPKPAAAAKKAPAKKALAKKA